MFVEGPGIDDIDSTEGIEVDQVPVTGDDVIHVIGDGGFQELVVVGIVSTPIWISSSDMWKRSGYLRRVSRNSESVSTETTIR